MELVDVISVMPGWTVESALKVKTSHYTLFLFLSASSGFPKKQFSNLNILLSYSKIDGRTGVDFNLTARFLRNLCFFKNSSSVPFSINYSASSFS